MRRRTPTKSAKEAMADYRHDEAKRKNNPPAKIAAEGAVPPMPKIEYAYSPRLPPVLRYDPTGAADKVPELLEEARERKLTQDELRLLAEALRKEEPWLEWAGKRELPSFAVDPVALHIHERVSAQAILRVAAREDVQRELFADPQQQYHEAVQFYQHNIDWANRLILGDSLQVMASLARREDLAGKVQMIYIDPPYGIRFSTNFQPTTDRSSAGDTNKGLTRELEMVKAYRDTWNLGIHSYLNYLRDRLIIAKELMADSGSIFVQISDENLHRVRMVMDDVFGAQQFVVTILIKKKGGQKGQTLEGVNDYLLWFTKDKEKAVKRIRNLYEANPISEELTDTFRWIEFENGGVATFAELGANGKNYSEDVESLFTDFQSAKLFKCENSTAGGVRKNQSVLFRFEGREFDPGIAKGNCWKHTAVSPDGNLSGMDRLAQADRLYIGENQIAFRRYTSDFGRKELTNWWDAFGGASSPVYVVQTNSRIIERCMLMTTDPGDLVLDPTCGGGTTAFVAEKWGRRWITIDTSRVAIAITRQRLLTAKLEYFALTETSRGVSGDFQYLTIPHITSSSIANNAALDPLFEKHEQVLEVKFSACNAALARVSEAIRQKLKGKLLAKQKTLGKKAITKADRRRWDLPRKWEHWQVPFDTDEDWPNELQAAVTEYRRAWRAKMDEVNACIEANAEQEELVDQPVKVSGVVRVSGPFTVEAVQPPEMSMSDVTATFNGEGLFEGEPEALDTTFEVRVVEPLGAMEVKNVEAYLDQMTRLLRTDGVRFPNNKQMRFTRLEPLVGTDSGLHAEGRWVPQGDSDEDVEGRAFVCVGFGPQYGPVTAKQVEQLIRDASRRGYDDLVVAGFSFDGPAQAAIEESQRKDLRIHMANIRPDVNPGMAGLLKEQPGSQLFTVFGQPRTSLAGPDDEGNYSVTMEGVDIYNPVDNSITPTGADKVAAWFIDSDYDGWTFCITQAFFPDRTAWDKLSRALNGPGGVIDEERFAALSGTVSLPFPAGKHKTVAVKVIDPRGNEVMKVHKLAS